MALIYALLSSPYFADATTKHLSLVTYLPDP